MNKFTPVRRPRGLRRTIAAWLLVPATLSFSAVVARADADLAVSLSADRVTVQPGVSGLDLVTFMLTVQNDGPDGAAVLVTNRLAAGLRIPPGMSAVADTGAFDPATGRWTVGNLSATRRASLQLPAQAIAGASGCLFNEASASFAGGAPATDPDTTNNVVRLTLGAPDCADLVIHTRRDDRLGASCADALHILRITNRGPTAATGVSLDITRYEVIDPPGFTERGCATGSVIVPGPDVIELGVIAAGAYQEFVTGLRDLQRDGPDIEVAYDARAAATEPDPGLAGNRETGRYTIRRPFDDDDDDDSDFLCIVSGALGGSGMERHLPELRRFRDRFLRSNKAGRSFVRWYQRISPPAARAVARHEALRTVVRVALTPVIYAVVYPLPATALVAATMLSLVLAQARVVRHQARSPLRGPPARASR